MVGATSSSSRVGLSLLVTNRHTARSEAVEEVDAIAGVSATQRDMHTGLADSSIDLSFYALTKDGRVKLSRYIPPGTTFYKYA